jgi:hypothetical protein
MGIIKLDRSRTHNVLLKFRIVFTDIFQTCFFWFVNPNFLLKIKYDIKDLNALLLKNLLNNAAKEYVFSKNCPKKLF